MSDAVDQDRLKQVWDDAVSSAIPNIDFFAFYTCQVTSQNSDGTLDLMPKSAALPSQKNIPFRCGIPGVTITVQAGAQVLMGWENGDPSVPFCALWLPGQAGDLQSVVISAAQAITLKANSVKIGPGTPTKGAARNSDSIQASLTLAEVNEFIFTAPSGGGPCVVTGPLSVTLDGEITEGSGSVEVSD
jgi:hypothetical protein